MADNVWWTTGYSSKKKLLADRRLNNVIMFGIFSALALSAANIYLNRLGVRRLSSREDLLRSTIVKHSSHKHDIYNKDGSDAPYKISVPRYEYVQDHTSNVYLGGGWF